MQVGPANLLYAKPTGYHATMTGIPYDDLDGWRGPYPADVFAEQFRQIAERWRPGLHELEQAAAAAPADHASEAHEDLIFARAAYLHFLSVAQQARFTSARNALLTNKGQSLPPAARQSLLASMRQAAEAEAQTARELWDLARENSCIGYEASNQYFYLPIDLMEKVVNCRYVVDSLQDRRP